jgi:hypothetical protein
MTASLLSVLLLASTLGPCQADVGRPFQITVIDEQTKRGVPLVELKTVNDISYFTDSNGIVAFHEPGLMGKEVFFHINSHGYEYAKDGFGFRGARLTTTPGGVATLTIKRINLAQRLYRITGAGIYRDSVLTGKAAPLREPLLNALVTGSDSVVNVVHRDKIFWFWGDTNRPSYPLGNFQVPGATSQLPGKGGLDPDVGIDLEYFIDDKGFAKETARMPGTGPTWITSLVVLPDDKGASRIYAAYVKVEPPLSIYARGFAVFDEQKQVFKQVNEVNMKDPAFPMGHPLRHRENGVDYVYFAHPLPLTRVPAEAKHFLRSEDYETFTCLKEGSRTTLDRDEQGKLRYAWRKNTPAVGPAEELALRKAGKIQPNDLRWQLRDRDTGKPLTPHSGSVAWNEYRRRWVMIAVQTGGTSMLGEVWLAEADMPTGPWTYAVKVLTHERYSFYNPKHHAMFDKEGGRVIYFEGTYTHTFSGNPQATPRYEYNQLMHKLDLGDPRTALPVAFYDVSTDNVPTRFTTIHHAGKSKGTVAFFALDRPGVDTVPIVAGKAGLYVGGKEGQGALFHAPPANAKGSDATTPLYEYRNAVTEARAYSTDAKLALPGFRREEEPLCRVWRP